MTRFNLPAGPEIGRLKQIVINALLSGELKLDEPKEVYLQYLEEHQ
jgi:hypothetical protein